MHASVFFASVPAIEIAGFEPGVALERVPVVRVERAAADFGDLAFAQFADGPVRVDRTHSAHVAEVELSEGCAHRATASLAGECEPALDFAVDVRDLSRRVEMAQHLGPLALDRRIDKYREPQCPCEAMPLGNRRVETSLWNDPDPCAAGRNQIVVAPLHRESIEVYYVAGNVQTDDVAPRAIADRAEEEAVDQDRPFPGGDVARDEHLAAL